ncbi:DUF4247 domain-containing protein [Streptomyces sp. RFCAC02]|uniref:DUF4247 domain-containing protein n=1 Tax=Streptomyces sp. RFCAC02 TaxID=2499143 RepID=UPI001021FE0E|nr:DUF4247 domain-containing protein [Streptomyces sp. RFCAC02]
MTARARAGAAATAATAALLLTACGADDPDVPRSWIADHYRPASTSASWQDTEDAPDRVADEIEGERGAMDRETGDSMVFLRYDDDIVIISPRTGGGSVIAIEDYATGRSHYSSYVSHWPSSQSSSGGDFRGGGPGSGK